MHFQKGLQYRIMGWDGLVIDDVGGGDPGRDVEGKNWSAWDGEGHQVWHMQKDLNHPGCFQIVNANGGCHLAASGSQVRVVQPENAGDHSAWKIALEVPYSLISPLNSPDFITMPLNADGTALSIAAPSSDHQRQWSILPNQSQYPTYGEWRDKLVEINGSGQMYIGPLVGELLVSVASNTTMDATLRESLESRLQFWQVSYDGITNGGQAAADAVKNAANAAGGVNPNWTDVDDALDTSGFDGQESR